MVALLVLMACQQLMQPHSNSTHMQDLKTGSFVANELLDDPKVKYQTIAYPLVATLVWQIERCVMEVEC